MTVKSYTPVKFEVNNRVCYWDENGVLESPGTVTRIKDSTEQIAVRWDDGTYDLYNEDQLVFLRPVCECGNRRRLCHPDV